MEKRVIFCSACDRDVQVLIGAGGSSGDVPDFSDVACLNEDKRCTGSLCPICAVAVSSQDGDSRTG